MGRALATGGQAFGQIANDMEQQANQLMIAEERKRKVVQNISQDVRQAFWRAYVAQQTLPRMEALLGRVKQALVRSSELEKGKLMPPMQALA